jgi:hypothetical protein
MVARIAALLLLAGSLAWGENAYVLVSGYESGYKDWGGKKVTGTGTVLDTSGTQKRFGSWAGRCASGSANGNAYAFKTLGRATRFTLRWSAYSNRPSSVPSLYHHLVKCIHIGGPNSLFSTNQWAYGASTDTFQMGVHVRDDNGMMSVDSIGLYPLKTWINYEATLDQTQNGRVTFRINGEVVYDTAACFDTSYVDSVCVGWFAGTTFDTGTVFYDAVSIDTGRAEYPNTNVFTYNAELGGLKGWYKTDVSGTGAVLADTNLASFSGVKALFCKPTANAASRVMGTILLPPSHTSRITGRFNLSNYTTTSTQARTLIRFVTRPSTLVGFCTVTARGDTSFILKCGVNDAGGSILASAPLDTLSDVGWHTIELFQRRETSLNAGDGMYRVYVDGTGNHGGVSLDTLQNWNYMPDSLKIGIQTATPFGETGYVLWDEIVVDTAGGEPGPMLLPGVQPSAVFRLRTREDE